MKQWKNSKYHVINKNHKDSIIKNIIITQTNHAAYKLCLDTSGINMMNNFSVTSPDWYWNGKIDSLVPELDGTYDLFMENFHAHITSDKMWHMDVYKYDNLWLFNFSGQYNKQIFFAGYSNKMSHFYVDTKFMFVRGNYIYVINNQGLWKMKVRRMKKDIRGNKCFTSVKNQYLDKFMDNYLAFGKAGIFKHIDLKIFSISYLQNMPTFYGLLSVHKTETEYLALAKLNDQFTISAGYYNGKIYCIVQIIEMVPTNNSELDFDAINNKIFMDIETNLNSDVIANNQISMGKDKDKFFSNYVFNNKIFMDEDKILSKKEIMHLPDNMELVPLLRQTTDVLYQPHVKYLCGYIKKIFLQMLLIRRYKINKMHYLYMLPKNVLFAIMHYLI